MWFIYSHAVLLGFKTWEKLNIVLMFRLFADWINDACFRLLLPNLCESAIVSPSVKAHRNWKNFYFGRWIQSERRPHLPKGPCRGTQCTGCRRSSSPPWCRCCNLGWRAEDLRPDRNWRFSVDRIRRCNIGDNPLQLKINKLDIYDDIIQPHNHSDSHTKKA